MNYRLAFLFLFLFSTGREVFSQQIKFAPALIPMFGVRIRVPCPAGEDPVFHYSISKEKDFAEAVFEGYFEEYFFWVKVYWFRDTLVDATRKDIEGLLWEDMEYEWDLCSAKTEGDFQRGGKLEYFYPKGVQLNQACVNEERDRFLFQGFFQGHWEVIWNLWWKPGTPPPKKEIQDAFFHYLLLPLE